jgi:hypothetical protein
MTREEAIPSDARKGNATAPDDYDELVELAHIWARNAYAATTDDVAHALWKMAKEYQPKRQRWEAHRISASRPAESD